MTVPATPRRAGPYNGTGAQTIFPFSFKAFDQTDLRVVVFDVPTNVESDATLNSDYTVTLNADQESTPGGTVNFSVAPTVNKRVTVIGDLQYEQPADLPDGGKFRAQQVEDAIDRIVILVQQLKEITDRCPQVQISSSDTQTLFENINVLSANIAVLQTVVDNIGDLVDLAAIAPQVATLAVVASSIPIVAAIDDDVAAVAAVAAEVAVVASNIAAILAAPGHASAAAASAQSAALSESNVVSTVANFTGRNKIINGKMVISQRGTNFPAISGAFGLDRWSLNGVLGSAVVTMSQQADGPSSAPEFRNSLRVAVTTADTSIAAGEIVMVSQSIEGYNIHDLVGRTFTLSFWVRSSKTGTHCVAMRNVGTNRSYVATYTVSAANTWERKTITVTGGLITAGTWDYTNSVGLYLNFVLSAGSTYQTTAGAWQTGNFMATSGQVNCMDTVGNVFALTGVQLEVGSVASPFEHRPFSYEYALCQRYFEASDGVSIWSGASINGSVFYVLTPFKVTKRAAPTVATGFSAANGFPNTGGPTVAAPLPGSFLAVNTANATTGGAYFQYSWTAEAEL